MLLERHDCDYRKHNQKWDRRNPRCYPRRVERRSVRLASFWPRRKLLRCPVIVLGCVSHDCLVFPYVQLDSLRYPVVPCLLRRTSGSDFRSVYGVLRAGLSGGLNSQPHLTQSRGEFPTSHASTSLTQMEERLFREGPRAALAKALQAPELWDRMPSCAAVANRRRAVVH
jgi:hypothetical protein